MRKGDVMQRMIRLSIYFLSLLALSCTGAYMSDREETCDSFEDARSFEVNGASYCMGSSSCPKSRPYDVRFEDSIYMNICADTMQVDRNEVLDELDSICESAQSEEDCDPDFGCSYVPEHHHHFYTDGMCENTAKGICVFAPDDIGQILICHTRAVPDSEAVEVIQINGYGSPTWRDRNEFSNNVTSAACKCWQ
jgi:hypothetical protein